jgi:hypothetical protein
VAFHFAVLAAGEILQLAARRFERVVKDDKGIFVSGVGFMAFGMPFEFRVRSRRMQRGLMFDNDFATGNREVDAYVKAFAMLLVLVRDLDHHAATDDPIVKLRQLVDFLADARIHGRGRIHVSIGDL